MDMQPTPRQRELIEQARTLALERFAPRAAQLDRDAVFPFEDYDDLHEAGLLALCVPEAYGGFGADLETYCLVAEQIAKGNASTALTYNMHCLTMLMMGEMADRHPLDDDVRAHHNALRAEKFREVAEQGVFYGQPHSEPVELGKTDKAFSVGGAPLRYAGREGRWRLRRQWPQILRVSVGCGRLFCHSRAVGGRCPMDRPHPVFAGAARRPWGHVHG